jgi:hypothetical protein
MDGRAELTQWALIEMDGGAELTTAQMKTFEVREPK